MRKVVIENNSKTVLLRDISDETPVFAKLDREIVGMIVGGAGGYVLMLPNGDAHGDYPKEIGGLIESLTGYGYEFFTE